MFFGDSDLPSLVSGPGYSPAEEGILVIRARGEGQGLAQKTILSGCALGPRAK